MLKRKQSMGNSEWSETLKNIEAIVSKAHIDSLIQRTVEEIKEKTAGKKAAYAWSGGKDSVVLEYVCELAGVSDCVLGRCNMEYPAFLAWIERHKPKNLTIINTGLDLDWLTKNMHALFPEPSFTYRHLIHEKAQNQYYRDSKLDVLLLGRRTADGNYVGSRTNIYTDAKGRTKYNPIAYWSHEETLAAMHYYGLPFAPFYSWKNGFKIGTHPWFVRPYAKDTQDAWQQIYEIDKSIVEEAAGKIESAKAFLEVAQCR